MNPETFRTDASLRSHGEQPVLRFLHSYDHDIERVWHHLTDNGTLSSLFGMRVRIRPVPGGTITFDWDGGKPDRGQVDEVTRPYELAYTWNRETLRWQLRPDGQGCILVLTATIDTDALIATSAAGFHLILDELESFLDSTAGRPGTLDMPDFGDLVDYYTTAWPDRR